jgi:hypothetical protein
MFGGGLWEGGDLERLSLVDDEEPNFNHMFQKMYQYYHLQATAKSKLFSRLFTFQTYTIGGSNVHVDMY